MKNFNNNIIAHIRPIHPHFAIHAVRPVVSFNTKNLIKINPKSGETEF